MGATENNELEYQIIETAKQLFIEKGFVETSMSDIAAKVGINRPTLHYYFRTKDRMFQAVFGSIVMSLLPKVQEIIQQELPFIDRVSLILDKYITLFTENPDMPKFICGEIQRDVNHLLDAAKEMQFEETFLIKGTTAHGNGSRQTKESTHTYSIHNFLWFAYFSFDYKKFDHQHIPERYYRFFGFYAGVEAIYSFSFDEFAGY